MPPVSGSMLPPLMAPAAAPVMNSIESPSPLPHLNAGGLPPAGGIRPVGNAGLPGLGRRDSSPMVTNDGAVISPQESGAASVATHVTSGSNAFEGALDGLDFGLDLFGMDSMPFTEELMAPGYTQMEMQM